MFFCEDRKGLKSAEPICGSYLFCVFQAPPCLDGMKFFCEMKPASHLHGALPQTPLLIAGGAKSNRKHDAKHVLRIYRLDVRNNLDYISPDWGGANMGTNQHRSSAWTVQEAKSKLSEVMRCARDDGPQIVGTRRPCVVVAKAEWDATTRVSEPFTRWLVENAPRGIELELPDRAGPADREDPFPDLR